MAETPTLCCRDGMELGSQATRLWGEPLDVHRVTFFGEGVGFFFLLNIISPSLGTFQKYNLEKNGAGGGEGPFGSQPDANSCPAEAGLQYQPPFLPSPGDSGALHPLPPAQLSLVAPWGHLSRETMATGQWGRRERWQECPHHNMSWKQGCLCRLICCLCPSQWHLWLEQVWCLLIG